MRTSNVEKLKSTVLLMRLAHRPRESLESGVNQLIIAIDTGSDIVDIALDATDPEYYTLILSKSTNPGRMIINNVPKENVRQYLQQERDRTDLYDKFKLLVLTSKSAEFVELTAFQLNSQQKGSLQNVYTQ